MTAWDRQTAMRALALALLSAFVAWLLTAATDEGGVAWGERAARVMPLAPLCAAAGSWLALLRGRARGEALALEALGRSPLQRAAAATAGGAVLALTAAAAALLVPSVDLRAFYPALHRAGAFQYVHGNFVDAARGVGVLADGAIIVLAPAGGSAPLPQVPLGGRASAALVTALAGIALPMLAAQTQRASLGRAALAAGAVVVGSILLFQSAAASRVPAVVATLPSLLLLGLVIWRYVAEASSSRL